MMRDFSLLSIIIPMYNEVAVLDHLFNQLLPICDALNKPYEIVCINDGSKDATMKQLLILQKTHTSIKIVDFFKNFGKEAALTAGLAYAKGDIVIPVDADLQDPPALIPALIEKWREGFDEVIATRESRKTDGWLKKLTARTFYKFFNKISEAPIEHDAGDFRLLDRSIVDVLLQLPEKNRFMKGLYGWVETQNVARVNFAREARAGGESKWNYWKLWNFALDGITAFSSLPLRVWSYLGVVISLFALGYIVLILAKTIIFGIDVSGYPSMMCVILFFGGVQLISLGVLGEYIARIYTESKNRPLYIVRNYITQDSACKQVN